MGEKSWVDHYWDFKHRTAQNYAPEEKEIRYSPAPTIYANSDWTTVKPGDYVKITKNPNGGHVGETGKVTRAYLEYGKNPMIHILMSDGQEEVLCQNWGDDFTPVIGPNEGRD